VDPNPVAEWYRDPAGRAEYRYWDGRGWSEWVATAGVSRVDAEALAPGMPPPPPVLASTPVFAPPVTTVYQRPYSSLKGLTVALYWVVGVEILAGLVRAGLLVNAVVKLNRFDDLSTFPRYEDWRDAHDAAGSAAGWVFLLAIPIFVLFVILTYRASRNTAPWNPQRPRWGAGWTIGGWFIPLAWFVIPCLVICEIWRRSAAGTQPGVARVVTWWVVFVVGILASSGISPDTLSEYRAEYLLNLAGSLILVAAALLFVFMVRELNARQTALSHGRGTT